MREVLIRENEAGQRLDKFLTKYFRLAPKSFLYKMMRKKNITLNKKKCEGSEKLASGDRVQFFLSEETMEKFSHLEKPPLIPSAKTNTKKLEIIYEDANILILNKPSGILSQKAKDSDCSLVEEIIQYLLESHQIQPEELTTFHPSVCNRLDRNTSGLVVAGKSLAGLQIMSEAFKERSLHKSYQCIVKGRVEEKQRISGFLQKDEKTNTVIVYSSEKEDTLPIVTEYLPLSGNEWYTRLEIALITGRTHQIRAHLASIGHPIVGDYKYGDEEVNQETRKKYGIRSQLLHSWKLEFPELPPPMQELGRKVFTAPLPRTFLRMEKGEGFYGKTIS